MEDTISSNTKLQLHKQKAICKDTVQYNHIRNKINDDSIFPILLLICKNIQTCNNYQNNIAISSNKKLVHNVSQTLGKQNINKNKDHNNIKVSDNHSKIQVPQQLLLPGMYQ